MTTTWGGEDHCPDQELNEPEPWTDEDQEALDDYNQACEDEAMERMDE